MENCKLNLEVLFSTTTFFAQLGLGKRDLTGILSRPLFTVTKLFEQETDHPYCTRFVGYRTEEN